MGDLIFVTGGARSGKSGFAERLAEQSGRPVTYIATLAPGDEEMRDRIARHRARRPAAWRTVEATDALAAAVAGAPGGDCVLLDCLAVWLANRLLALADEEPSAAALETIEAESAAAVGALIEAARAREAATIVVTNEVGDGVVPPYALGRAYRDLLGRANQQLSGAAVQAWLLVAGRALALPPP